VARLEWLAQNHGCVVVITGDAEPDLFADLDPGRVGRAWPRDAERINARAIANGEFSWTLIAHPNSGWARAVFGVDETAALVLLRAALAHALRLDAPDPAAAWAEHIDGLLQRATQLDHLALDSLRFQGGGTDLSVGLLPKARWRAAISETSDGIRYVANLPTEEVFTTPDFRRTSGTVHATRPTIVRGVPVEGLRLEFCEGRVVRAHAESGLDVLTGVFESDPASAALGEVALVDRDSRVGRLGTTFRQTLFDENAASHIALGRALPQSFDDDLGPTDKWAEHGVNYAAAHVDVIIGSDELAVDGVRAGGDAVALLRAGAWQL
jgi:aminopeptidase